MIVDSMTWEEVIKHFDEDKSNYQNKLASFIKSFSSLILHSRTFPLRRMYLYTTPKTNNSYMFMFEANKRGEWKNPKYRTILLFNQNEGKYALTYAIPVHQPETICYIIYSPHFWGRFKERILKDPALKTDDVLERFFIRNSSFQLDEVSEGYSLEFEKHEKEGQTQYVLKINDGLCFGSAVYHNTMMMKTIVSKEMLSNKQIEALNEKASR